jgi:hypothetical protein
MTQLYFLGQLACCHLHNVLDPCTSTTEEEEGKEENYEKAVGRCWTDEQGAKVYRYTMKAQSQETRAYMEAIGEGKREDEEDEDEDEEEEEEEDEEVEEEEHAEDEEGEEVKVYGHTMRPDLPARRRRRRRRTASTPRTTRATRRSRAA